jgi:hypothetical protein
VSALLGPWAQGYVSAWDEAAAWCAGRAAVLDGPAHAAMWDAYLELSKQAKDARENLSRLGEQESA